MDEKSELEKFIDYQIDKFKQISRHEMVDVYTTMKRIFNLIKEN